MCRPFCVYPGGYPCTGGRLRSDGRLCNTSRGIPLPPVASRCSPWPSDDDDDADDDDDDYDDDLIVIYLWKPDDYYYYSIIKLVYNACDR